jgi:WD40 repeat protein
VRRREVDERGSALREVLGRFGTLRDAGSVEVIAMSPDGRHVLTSRIDEIARMWDTRSGTLIAQIPYRLETSAAFSGDGARLAVAAETGVQVFATTSGRTLAKFEAKGSFRTVLIDHDGQRLIAKNNGAVSLWDVDAGRALVTTEQVRAVRLAPGGRTIATETGNQARLWDAATGKMLAEVDCQCHIRETVFSADGRFAVIVSEANSVYVRSTTLCEVSRELKYSGVIGQVAFSPDGKLLAMSGSDPIMAETKGNVGQPRATGQGEPWLRLVEVRSGREIDLEQERAEGAALVFSADARYLAAGAVIWDAVSGRRLARAEGPVVAFSPDGSLLLTQDGGFVRVWPWRSDDMLALACRQLPRNLSDEEWQRHVSREEPPRETCAGLR